MLFTNENYFCYDSVLMSLFTHMRHKVQNMLVTDTNLQSESSSIKHIQIREILNYVDFTTLIQIYPLEW
jgi:hypothetical protein